MIIEVRTYKIKSGRRDEFIRIFFSRAIPAQLSHGMKILGPLLDTEDRDTFVFLRSFPSMESRDQMTQAFYSSRDWKEELESIVKPMIEQSQLRLTETAEGWLRF